MIEEFQYEGEWWIPEEPKNKIRGTLFFSPKDGIRLELTGSFKGNEQTMFQIVLGFTINGKKITLSRCVQYHLTKHIPGDEISKLKVLEIFVGEHFSKLENIKFDSLLVHYSYLNEWAGFKTFKTEHGKDEETIITHKKPKSIEVRIDDNLKLKLTSMVRESGSRTKFCVEEETYFTIKSSNKLTFNNCRKYTRILQNLLTLANGEDVSYPLKIQAHIENGHDFRKIDIYYAISDIKDSTMIRQKMLFTYDTIFKCFEIFIKNWFENYENKSLETAINLYFGTIHNERLYVDNQFLNYMIGIEAYHRCVFGGKYISDNENEKIHNKLVKVIKDVDKDFRQSLEYKFKFLHEYSLAKRLKELYNEYEEVIGNIIDDRDTFIQETKDTRNYLIHNDPKSKGKACGGKDLIILTKKLEFLLEICILTILGFNKADIITLFSKNQRYKKEFIDEYNRII